MKKFIPFLTSDYFVFIAITAVVVAICIIFH